MSLYDILFLVIFQLLFPGFLFSLLILFVVQILMGCEDSDAKFLCAIKNVQSFPENSSICS